MSRKDNRLGPQQKKINKVIFAVGGKNTRMLPLKQAKETLPLAVESTVIETLVQQASEAGVTTGIMVTARGKGPTEDLFDRDLALEMLLEKRGKEKELALVRKSSELMDLAFTRQSEPLGDGHAILQAVPLIKEEEAVFVMFGDTICYRPGQPNSLQQMEEVYQATGAPIVLLSRVDPAKAYKYGIVKVTENQYGLKIESLVEKPQQDAPSDLAVVGQYIMTPFLRERLKFVKPGVDGEIKFADALKEYILLGYPVYGCIMEGQWLDVGDKIGYIQAFFRYAIDDPEFGEQAKLIMQEMLASANIDKS